MKVNFNTEEMKIFQFMLNNREKITTIVFSHNMSAKREFSNLKKALFQNSLHGFVKKFDALTLCIYLRNKSIIKFEYFKDAGEAKGTMRDYIYFDVELKDQSLTHQLKMRSLNEIYFDNRELKILNIQ